MQEIVDNGANAWKMRGLFLGAALFCGLFFWLAADTGRSGDMATAVGIAASGLGAAWAGVLYARRYVIHLGSDAADLTIVTAGLLGFRILVVSRSATSDLNFYTGERRGQRDLPFATLRITGRWVPFIVDLSAARVDESALRSLLQRKRKRKQQR